MQYICLSITECTLSYQIIILTWKEKNMVGYFKNIYLPSKLVIGSRLRMLRLAVLLSSYCVVSGKYVRQVNARTPFGNIIGHVRQENYDIGPGAVTDTVNEWLGVQYGMADRWQDSTLPDLSTEDFFAFEPYPSCPQVHYYQHTFPPNQFENCLYLSVFSPVTTPGALHPVMVFIHGGSYEDGTGMRFDSFPLAAHGVVVVTINYRLAQLGFLTTGNSVLPGNYGLRDQIVALEWVKQTIHHFGGNSSRVTLFGSSAGAASIGLIMTIPEADGLYHRVILQSGSPLAFWAVYQSGVDFIGHIKELASLVGCREETTTQQIDCLKRVNEHLFADVHHEISHYTPSGLNYKPLIDGITLREHPRTAFENGRFHKVPVMTGFVSDEWSRNAGLFFLEVDESVIDKNFDDGFDRYSFVKAVRHVIVERFHWPEHIVPLVIQLYTNKSRVDDPAYNREQYIEFMGDLTMYAPGVELANMLYQQGVPVYMYEFEHSPQHSPFPWWGTFHSSELNYVFGGPFTGFNMVMDELLNHTQSEVDICRQVMQYWSSFAKYGYPEPKNINLQAENTRWPRYTEINRDHLYISLNTTEIRYNFKVLTTTFIIDLLPKLISVVSEPVLGQVTTSCFEKAATVWILVGVCCALCLMLLVLCFAYLKSRNTVKKLKIIYTPKEAIKCLA